MRRQIPQRNVWFQDILPKAWSASGGARTPRMEAYHRKRLFRKELIGLLEKSGVRCDAKYLD